MVSKFIKKIVLIAILNCQHIDCLIFYYWQPKTHTNFGDFISLKLIERIIQQKVKIANPDITETYERKLLAIGSIISRAQDNDIIWGSGINGKYLNPKDKKYYIFSKLDVRLVRGPLTASFLKENFNITSPEFYGDPALLFPYFFPEFKRKKEPKIEFLIVPHLTEQHLFSKNNLNNVIYTTDPWEEILLKILDSKFVISGSLHALIIAEAYGIPARCLKITDNEPNFKYIDYYLGTNRPYFKIAKSVKEALSMKGEPPFECDLNKIYSSFPFEYYENINIKKINFFNIP